MCCGKFSYVLSQVRFEQNTNVRKILVKPSKTFQSADVGSGAAVLGKVDTRLIHPANLNKIS